jgi:hypothetical protein
MFFSIGFEFALDIAAAITEDPAHSIAEAKARIAEVSKEAA